MSVSALGVSPRHGLRSINVWPDKLRHAAQSSLGAASLLSAASAARLPLPRTPQTRWSEMSFKDPGLGDRLASAASAKNAALAKSRAKPAADDPAVLKRQAERAAECLAV